MKKAFIIGSVSDLAIERIKLGLGLKEDVEIICVESIEDVPIQERLKYAGSHIHDIHTLKKLEEDIKLLPSIHYAEDKKRKGHERPYKYHR